MPHLHLDHSAELATESDMQALCDSLRDTLVATGVFPLAGVRVRCHPAAASTVADGHPANRYCAMTLSVGAGRDTATLQAAGNQVFAAAHAHFSDLLAQPHFALSLEIRVANPELSWKDTPLHQRLSAPPEGGTQ